MTSIALFFTTLYLIIINLLFILGWYSSTYSFKFLYSLVGKTFSRSYTDKVATLWGMVMLKGAFWFNRVRVDFEADPHTQEYDGPYIIIMNHQATFDIGLAYYIMWRLGKRHIRWVLKKELRKAPLVGSACAEMKSAFVDRKDRDQAETELRNFSDYLKKDNISPCIFVEGTRATLKKLEKSDFQHVLNPRPLGLAILHENLPDWPILSVTIDWQNTNNGVTIFGTSIWRSVIKVSTRVYQADEIGEDISKWLLKEEWPRYDEILKNWNPSKEKAPQTVGTEHPTAEHS